jgi:Immunity protein family (Imm11)
VKVYRFQVQEGYEWVVPLSDTDFEVFLSFGGSKRATDWRPIEMRLVTEDERGRRFLPSDMPWLGQHAPVMRPRATAALSPVLAGDGEILPLACRDAQLAVFNTLTVVPALDVERSSVVRFPSSGRIMTVKAHVFRSELLEGVNAFKVPELLRSAVFVSEAVVRAAHQARLNGVGFKLVWDG